MTLITQPRTVTDRDLTLGQFVAERGHVRTLQTGQMLFHEGDSSNAVYACVRGRINVFITAPTGRSVMLGFKVPTQAFGELSAIDGGRRSAGAVAVGPSTVAMMTGDAFLEQLDCVPHLSWVVLRELCDHVRRVNARVAAQSSENTTERVGHLLIELAAKFRRHNAGDDRKELPISQDEVAAWVGATREATARSLASFRRAGAVETARNMITIVDVTSLNAVILGCSHMGGGSSPRSSSGPGMPMK